MKGGLLSMVLEIGGSRSARARRVLGLLLLLLAPVMVGALWAQPVAEVLPMPVGRIMHGSAVLGDHLYAAGGVLITADEKDDFTSTVVGANIRADGSLGAWFDARPLPHNRRYVEAATVVLEDVLYIAGGISGETSYAKTVLWSKEESPGILADWVESPPFSERGAMFVTAVTTPGHLHLVGGAEGDDEGMRQPTAEVTTAPLEADGAITRWVKGPPMPQALWAHQAATAGGRLWVWGGLPTAKYEPRSYSIYSAPLLASGGVGEWSESPVRLGASMQAGVSTAAGPFLISFMPRIEGKIDWNIWFAQLQADGQPGPWQSLAAGLPNRAYFSLANDYRRGRIYVVGGKEQRGDYPYDPRVFTLTLAAEVVSVPGEAGEQPAVAGASVAGASASVAAPAAPADPSSYFIGYDSARRIASLPPGRPLLVLFHHPGSRASQQQMVALEDTARLQALTSRAVFSLVDVRQHAQLAQQLGITRTPTWLVYDRQGNITGKAGLLSMEQLEQGLSGL